MRLPARPRRRNAIVLTSLVDVLFVLLFFFMLVTTYGDERGLSMALGGPGAASAARPLPATTSSAAAAASGATIVQVQADGGLLLDARPASFDEVATRLRTPQARAVLVAARGVSLQTAVDVLDRLRPTGAALTLGRAAP